MWVENVCFIVQGLILSEEAVPQLAGDSTGKPCLAHSVNPPAIFTTLL